MDLSACILIYCFCRGRVSISKFSDGRLTVQQAHNGLQIFFNTMN